MITAAAHTYQDASTIDACTKPVAAGRDLRLDLFRGIALLLIFVDHIAGNAFAAFTLQKLGFADAAEVFVFIAGMAGFYAYRRKFVSESFLAGVAAVFTRIRTLYLAHMLMLALLLALAALTAAAGSGYDIIAKLGLRPLTETPFEALVRLPMLAYLPHYMDILPLYVLLLATLPLILIGMNVHALLPLGVSALLYGAVQMTGINLPNFGLDGWLLNPFAWAIVFVTGATAARLTQDGFWLRLPKGVNFAMTLAAAAYVVFAFLEAGPWRVIPELESYAISTTPMLADKTNLSWHRLADIAAKVWLAAVFAPRVSAAYESGLGLALIRAGRHSLQLFVLGTVMSIAASILVFEAAGAMWMQALMTFGGIALLLAYAARLELGCWPVPTLPIGLGSSQHLNLR